MAAQDGSGNSTSLMDLITADVPASRGVLESALPSPKGVDRKGRKLGLISVPESTTSPLKVVSPGTTGFGPLKQKKKPLSYAQLARSLHEYASSADQKSSQRKLLHHVFPKLAVYSSVDPSLAPSLLMLQEQADDNNVQRYCYYYVARILSESGPESGIPGGGIPTPNWDALADLNVSGGVTRADVAPLILSKLSIEATTTDNAAHARRIAALKALSFSPTSNNDVLDKLYEIVFGILNKVADTGKPRRKKGIFGKQTVDKESAMRSNLQSAALSALRRLPLDSGNPAFLHRAVQGIACADPVGVRHALAMVCDLAVRDPYGAAMAVAKLSLAGGSLQEVLRIHDVMARVYLARLCYALAKAPVLDERPDLKSQFTMILYQLLLDPSERVCFEAAHCILGKFDNTESPEVRGAGWLLLTTAVLKFPDISTKNLTAVSTKDEGGVKNGTPPKVPIDRPPMRPRRPQRIIKLVMRRLEAALRSHSRPVLHAAVRTVQELGRSRAAAASLGYGVDEEALLEGYENGTNEIIESGDDAPRMRGIAGKETIGAMLSALMEAVRTSVACECVYVRAAAIKAMIWMQSQYESVKELKAIIDGELSDPSWPASLLNDILLTLHARFKATPGMAVILLEISRLFATKAPGKMDSDVLQLLWKTCLVGCGPEGKHTALEAVTVVLDLPPPAPISWSNNYAASDQKSALALQRLIQAAVWFLGENANYAAEEYAWESATAPGTALLMLDRDKMVAEASSRNPTLAGAMARLQRCAFSGSWEVRIVAAQALMTVAIRSGEPYRIQIYEFLRALAQGGAKKKLRDVYASNGEDQGASGTGLSSILSPMLRVLDDMYQAQDLLIKDMRRHDNIKEEWTDEELKTLYESHERLLDLVSLFCFVPRAKYLPLGPISAGLINIYRNRHHIDAATGLNDPAVAMGISDLINYTTDQTKYPPIQLEPATLVTASLYQEDDQEGIWSINPPGLDRINDYLGGAGTDAPEVEEETVVARESTSYTDMWAKTLLETSDREDVDDQSSGSSSPASVQSGSTTFSRFGSNRYPSLFGGGNNTRKEEKQTSSWVPNLSMPSFQESASKLDSPGRMSNAGGARKPFDTDLYRRTSFDGSHSVDQTSAQLYEDTPDSPQDEEREEFGEALYDFTAGGEDELNLVAGEELEIKYEVDGWFFVKKKRPGRDGRMTGLVPVTYVGAL